MSPHPSSEIKINLRVPTKSVYSGSGEELCPNDGCKYTLAYTYCISYNGDLWEVMQLLMFVKITYSLGRIEMFS